MKSLSCISTIAIMCLSVLGWWNHRKLTALREDRDRLSIRASKFGISMENGRTNSRLRPDRMAEARLAAMRFIQHHKQREAIRLAGGDPEKNVETAAYGAREWMAALDAKQIRVVIEEILRDPELDDKARRKLIGQSVGFLAEKNPISTLSLFIEFSNHLKDTGLGRQVVCGALGNLAKENPQAAIAWARNHMKEFPVIIQAAQDSLVTGTALQEPALAFEIVREFKSEESEGHAEASILGQSEPQLRTMAFAAFREHLATFNKIEDRRQVENVAWQAMAKVVAADGFEAGSKWLLSVEPTPAELSSILGYMGVGLINSKKMDQSAKWVEWIAKTLPAEEGEKPIIRIVNSWTRDDPEAVGKWLVSTPEGPVKQAAIRGYAEAVFNHDPETAMQWIMTLPSNKGRETSLKNFYYWWPKDDPAGKEAFAKEHGIK